MTKFRHISQILGKRHISILSTRNVIWTLGDEGIGACDVSRWKSWKISIVCSKIFIFWIHLYKVYKIQHFRKCIYMLIINPGLAARVLLYFYSQLSTINNASEASAESKKVRDVSKGGGGVSRKMSIRRFSWTKSICDASLTHQGRHANQLLRIRPWMFHYYNN